MHGSFFANYRPARAEETRDKCDPEIVCSRKITPLSWSQRRDRSWDRSDSPLVNNYGKRRYRTPCFQLDSELTPGSVPSVRKLAESRGGGKERTKENRPRGIDRSLARSLDFSRDSLIQVSRGKAASAKLKSLPRARLSTSGTSRKFENVQTSR